MSKLTPCLVLVVTFAGCGNKKTADQNAAKNKPSDEAAQQAKPSDDNAPSEGESNTHFVIQGAPHSGTYIDCTLAPDVGGLTSINCSGLPKCEDDCTLMIPFPSKPGTYSCSTGQTNVLLKDPGIPANMAHMHVAGAGCDSTDQAPSPGAPNPGCPKDSSGCNRVWGDCTVTVSSVDTSHSVDTPAGHFSGTIKATVYNTEEKEDCPGSDAVKGGGQSYSITVTGAW